LLSLMVACCPPALAQSVPAAELIAAAKAATLSQIDGRSKSCEDDRRVDDWLAEVTGATARSIRWQGGRCVLALPDNPIDAGTKNWCAHAVITPRRRAAGPAQPSPSAPVS
jgi:hypothetical protein